MAQHETPIVQHQTKPEMVAKRTDCGSMRAVADDNHGTRLRQPNSLRAGTLGPPLLEDFIFRERSLTGPLAHPRADVHARDRARTGSFKPLKSMAKFTRAAFLPDPKKKRRSSCLLHRGRWRRHPRHAARRPRLCLKFTTRKGNFDLVLPQHPISLRTRSKFGLIPSVRWSPIAGFPRLALRRQFWAFATAEPESMHM